MVRKNIFGSKFAASSKVKVQLCGFVMRKKGRIQRQAKGSQSCRGSRDCAEKHSMFIDTLTQLRALGDGYFLRKLRKR